MPKLERRLRIRADHDGSWTWAAHEKPASRGKAPASWEQVDVGTGYETSYAATEAAQKAYPDWPLEAVGSQA